MSGIDSRKDAYTITTKIFKILGVELNVDKAHQMWLMIDEVFSVVDRADRLEEMIDRMSETGVKKDAEIDYLKRKNYELAHDNDLLAERIANLEKRIRITRRA